MDKARKKFILLSELTVMLLLAVLLSVINILSFTMAAEDADHLTESISHNQGFIKGFVPEFSPEQEDNAQGQPPQETSDDGQMTDQTQNNNGSAYKNKKRDVKPFILNGGRGGMGPNSPDMNNSLRYFTVAFDKDDNAEMIDFRMSAVSEDEAKEWAESLIDGSTGWTNTSYRYRVYTIGDRTYVTVIDQGRELWQSYRILIISIVGGAVLIVLSFFLFHFIGRKLFRPIEEADRKQKQFIARLESEFKMPLTIINADTESLEIKNGENEQTKSINKQVKRMTRLVKEFGSLSVVDEPAQKTKIDLSGLMTAVLENSRKSFDEKKIDLSCDIEPEIFYTISDEAIRKIMRELISNSLRFSNSKASYSLKKHKDRIKICQMNDTSLADGSYDQIFDRFTVLDNAEKSGGSGLGLSYVKEAVRASNGRISARVKNGIMIIEINL